MITENSTTASNISAILLAAGLSSRMGRPKLLLPWGETTVLGQVVSTFAAVGLKDLVIVTGAVREEIERKAAELAKNFPVRCVYNPDFEHGGMLSSIQVGLTALSSQTNAALIALGDQPQVLEETVRGICDSYVRTNSSLVIPSFQNQRGHPWLAARNLWANILKLPSTSTPKQFLNAYTGHVEYIPASPSILQDLDTPSEYERLRP
jgi:molybdenum cofactor cytidylyltransferase